MVSEVSHEASFEWDMASYEWLVAKETHVMADWHIWKLR